MRLTTLYIDLTRPATSALVSDVTAEQEERSRPNFVVRDTHKLRLVLVKDGVGVDLEAGQTLAFGGKVTSFATGSVSFLFFQNTFTKVIAGSEIGFEAELDCNTTEFINAMDGNTSQNIVIETELRDAGKVITLMQADATAVHDVVTGAENAPTSSDPNFLDESETRALVTGGGQDAVFNSISVEEPGNHSLDEAVAELEGTTLVVPSPGKGNVLLVRRSTGGSPGGDEITAFTGLSQGTLYWLVHDDGATDPIRYRGMLIRDGGGGPIAIRATSATTAVLATPTISTFSWGGNETQTNPAGPSYFLANGDGTDALASLGDNETEHVVLRPGRITQASVRMDSIVSSNVDLHVAVNGTDQQVVQLSNAQSAQVVDLDVAVSAGDRVSVAPRPNGEAPGQTIVTLHVQND